MDGLPVTIRLLDPPLHEFLPDLTELSCGSPSPARRAREQDRSCSRRSAALHEQNPMLGLRGVRLGPGHPGPARHAGARDRRRGCGARQGGRRPASGDHDPADRAPCRRWRSAGSEPRRCSREVEEETGVHVETRIGTMIEVPRAALTAGEIARLGGVLLLRHQRPDPDDLGLLPRRRGGRILRPPTSSMGIFGVSPVRDDRPRRRGPAGADRRAREGAPPAPASSSASAASTAATPRRSSSSTRSGLDYVSCSPFRVPIARLEAGRAAVVSAGSDTR